MMSATTDGSFDGVVAFREARWKTRWIVAGLAVILAWRSVTLVDLESLSAIPWWLLLVLIGIAPQLFLLLFPLVTRDPNRPSTFGMPTLRRCLIEFAIAVPVVIVAVLALAGASLMLERASPGSSLRPDAFTNMAKSPDKTSVYLLLLFSITFAPIAEETFFRGFLQNAFRARMHWLVATVIQSLIFGLGHFFGGMHSGVAFFLGIVITLHYQWRKTLVAPILVHAGMNTLSALGMLLMMQEHANGPFLGVVGDAKDAACVVREVLPDSPAHWAGLRVGDVITSFNGEPIRDFPQFVDTLARYRPNDTVSVAVEREGSPLELAVRLERRGEHW